MDAAERKRHLGLALRRLEAGRWREAERACRPLRDADPGDVDAALLTALAVAGSGEAERAAPILGLVAQARPDHAHPCRDLEALKPPLPADRIIAQYRACLRLTPSHARLRRDFAAYLLDHDGAAEAETLLHGYLDTAAAENLMGMALAELGRFTDATAHFRRAVALDPVPSMGWTNLGLVLKVERQFDAAIAAYGEAVARSPDDVRIRVNRAVALLQAGRWTEAWQDHDLRLRLPGHVGLPEDRLLPSLIEAGDLHGKTILVVHEEGFGDTLQYARYLPLMAARGARVVARVPGPLARLLRRITGVASVVTESGRLPPYDFHCPFPSLPRAFGTTVRSVPDAPYLTADPTLAKSWAPFVRHDRHALAVGLVWAGQARPWLPGFSTVDRRRSVGLAALAPLAAVGGVRFISLQMGEPAAEARHPPAAMRLVNPMGAVTSFADTAAIIANLDLVISVDTAVAHLAGAMGRKVFLLNRYDNCWRWLSGRADTPWYPSMTIFRQDSPNDWAGPVANVAAALAALADFSGAGGTRPPPPPGFADAA